MTAEITPYEAQLYDRQIRLWGVDAQRRMRNSRVLVVGLTALSAEASADELREWFALFDESSSGQVPTKEVGTMLRAIGEMVSEDEIKAIQRQIGTPTFNSSMWMTVVQRRQKYRTAEEDLKEAFHVFDKNGKGINVRELRHAMKCLGDKVSDQEFNEFLKELGVSEAGTIQYADLHKKVFAK